MKANRIVSLLLVFLMAAAMFTLPAAAAQDKPDETVSVAKKEEPIPPEPGQEKEPETDPFKLSGKDITALYTSKSGTFMMSPFYKDDPAYETFASVISGLKPAEIEMEAVEAASSIEGSFLLIHKDSSRIIYTLNTKGRIQVSGKAYQIDEASYHKLLALYKEKKPASNYAQWLIYMIPKRVTGVTFATTADSEGVIVSEDYMRDVLAKIRSIRVSGGESYYPIREDLKPGNGAIKISLHFPEDGRYDLWLVGNTLYLQTSDMHIGCKYTVDAGDAQIILNALKSPGTVSGQAA